MTETTAQERVARLVENWDWPEPQILEDIVALGEAALPAITAVLTPDFLQAASADDQADAIAFYLAQILGAIGSPQAIPLVVEMFRWLDDDTIDDLPDIVQALGPGAIDPLLSVADGSLLWYPRAMASEAAVALAGADAARRGRVAAGLRGVLSGFLARTETLSDDERDTVASIIADLANLADPEARPLIDAAFEAGIVGHRPSGEDSFWDAPIITQDGVEETYREGGGEPRPASFRTFLERYPQDRRVHFAEEEKLCEAEALLPLLEDGEVPEPFVRGPRLGRNDPCWCGKGKKYKKCHLAEDEKLGR